MTSTSIVWLKNGQNSEERAGDGTSRATWNTGLPKSSARGGTTTGTANFDLLPHHPSFLPHRLEQRPALVAAIYITGYGL